jgi:ferrous iron transport protein A
MVLATLTKLRILTETHPDCLTKDTALWNNSATVNINPLNTSMTLASLKPGETATIVAIHTDEALHQRLLAMGFRAGKQIELIRKASFSGPLQVRIGTTDILLRKAEAAKITVQI